MTDIEIQKRLSGNMKLYRKDNGFSQEKLAELADVSPETIKSIELLRSWPSQKSLSAIASALNIDVYKLFLPIPSSFEIEFEIKQKILNSAHQGFEKFLETIKDDVTDI